MLTTKGFSVKSQDVPLHEGLLDLVPQDQVLLVDLLSWQSAAGWTCAAPGTRPWKQSLSVPHGPWLCPPPLPAWGSKLTPFRTLSVYGTEG